MWMLKWRIDIYRLTKRSAHSSRLFSTSLSYASKRKRAWSSPARLPLLAAASILFGLTIWMPEGSWLKKKLPRMKIEDNKKVKGYEEAGREWSASS